MSNAQNIFRTTQANLIAAYGMSTGADLASLAVEMVQERLDLELNGTAAELEAFSQDVSETLAEITERGQDRMLVIRCMQAYRGYVESL